MGRQKVKNIEAPFGELNTNTFSIVLNTAHDTLVSLSANLGVRLGG